MTFDLNHQQDEQLAMAYMACSPCSAGLYFTGMARYENQRLKLKIMMGPRVGGEAWLNKGCSTYQQSSTMILTHYI